MQGLTCFIPPSLIGESKFAFVEIEIFVDEVIAKQACIMFLAVSEIELSCIACRTEVVVGGYAVSKRIAF